MLFCIFKAFHKLTQTCDHVDKRPYKSKSLFFSSSARIFFVKSVIASYANVQRGAMNTERSGKEKKVTTSNNDA